MHEEKLPAKKDKSKECNGLPEGQGRKLSDRINRPQGEQE